MHEAVKERLPAIAEACRRHRVVRLDVFGSAARGVDFDPVHSDADFLVDFSPGYGVDEYLGLADALEKAMGRSVDLVTRKAVDTSHNEIRRASILAGRELVYGG